MVAFRLPEEMWAWAWSAKFLSLAQEKKSEGGIILPNSDPEPEPALCHFSRLIEGTEYSWLWLFLYPYEACALRTLPQVLQDSNAELIADTLVTAPSSQWESPTYLQRVHLDWIGRLPLLALGIQEVWIGFDWKTYARDRDLRGTTKHIYPADEFCRLAQR